MATPIISGIYLITNLINFKVYVGSTLNFRHRKAVHLHRLKNKSCDANKHLLAAWRKYGEENFSFEIIERIPKNLLKEREDYWIVAYDALNPECGYNIAADTACGLRGYKRTEEDIEHLVKDWKFINPDGEVVNIHNLKKFCRENHLEHLPLADVHRGKVLQARGWRKYSEHLVGKLFEGRDWAIPQLKNKKQYQFLNPNGKLITVNGLKEFCRNNKLDAGHMVKVHNKTRKQYKGWRIV